MYFCACAKLLFYCYQGSHGHEISGKVLKLQNFPVLEKFWNLANPGPGPGKALDLFVYALVLASLAC